jgi:hypothetical protein
VSRFGLVAAFTIRSLYNSDNYVVFTELEISGALFPPVGTTLRYTYTDGFVSSGACYPKIGTVLSN